MDIEYLLTEQAFYINCILGETYEEYKERILAEYEEED
jgi:hypothetical protein